MNKAKADFQKRLGKHIVKLRLAKKWSQSELAREADKERQSLERVENGKTNPTAYYLHDLAVALDLPLSKLLDFEMP